MAIGAIFVDGGNISHQLMAMGRKPRLDYFKLAELLARHASPDAVLVNYALKAYFEAHHGEESLERRKDFHRILKEANWSLFSFPAKLCSDGVWRDKGLDITLALEAHTLAVLAQIQVFVLVSHDADFAALFRYLGKDIFKVVVGFRGKIGQELAKEADRVVLIENLGAGVFL